MPNPAKKLFAHSFRKCKNMTQPMDKKRDSYPSVSPSRGLFLIYLIEHEDGTLSVLSESVGKAPNARALGIDLMMTLEEVASFSAGNIRIQSHHQSPSYQ